MTTSRRTFTQVKDILRKIDRSISDAREKRLSSEATGGADTGRHTGIRPGGMATSPARSTSGVGDRLPSRVG